MAEIIEFPCAEEEEQIAIPIEYSSAFYESGKLLSDFIRDLPISGADNEKLIELMHAHMEEAAKSGWFSGFRIGNEFKEQDYK